MRIAWIGLGSMGKPMAQSVMRGGHELVGFARRPEAQDAVRQAGGIVTADLLRTVADADLVCVCLFSEAQIREVVVAGGALAAMPPGAILAVHSTVRPGFVRALADAHPAIALLDAGFSGGPEEALTGKLTLMIGGEAATLERARPVFRTYAEHIAHAGPLGSGMMLKAINNLTFAANVAMARDALRLARSAGLEPGVTIATLLRGSARSTALEFLCRNGDPEQRFLAISRFLLKDVPIAHEMSEGSTLGTLEAATREFLGAAS